jgi:hypothetical protein
VSVFTFAFGFSLASNANVRSFRAPGVYVVPASVLERAKQYLESHASEFSNHEYLAVADMTRPSSEKRLTVLHVPSGQTQNFYVAHGRGSDPSWTGVPQSFSNTSGSLKTSIGFYRTAEIYQGEHGRTMRLDGMSQSNSNARDRAIVLHGASYVSADYIRTYGKLGRTWGCPGVDFADRDRLIGMLKNRALLYIWGGQTLDAPRMDARAALSLASVDTSAAEVEAGPEAGTKAGAKAEPAMTTEAEPAMIAEAMSFTGSPDTDESADTETTRESDWSPDAAMFMGNFSPR